MEFSPDGAVRMTQGDFSAAGTYKLIGNGRLRIQLKNVEQTIELKYSVNGAELTTEDEFGTTTRFRKLGN